MCIVSKTVRIYTVELQVLSNQADCVETRVIFRAPCKHDSAKVAARPGVVLHIAHNSKLWLI